MYPMVTVPVPVAAGTIVLTFLGARGGLRAWPAAAGNDASD
ncbi:MAG: hypothetical protein M0030_01205 [Actinomycetota bacterium]|nr:hypothetical protein [Actinomycetota bacterium]